MGSFHDPTASFESWIGPLFKGLFASLSIVPFNDRMRCRRALVARIGAEIVMPRSARHLYHESIQCGLKQFYVMRVCAADDERQRDSNSVDQQAVASGALCIAPSMLCHF